MSELADLLIGLATVLVISIVLAMLQCYRLLSRAQREYERARGVVEDIVLSFNRELRQHVDRLEQVAYKTQALASRSDVSLKKSDDATKLVQQLESKITSVTAMGEQTSAKISDLEKRILDIDKSQTSLTTKLGTLEEKTAKPLVITEPNIEAVIPIKRDKALAPLTQTELAVLEMLTAEGAKTAPEIKERLKLSREHTARLMKKLYESGYLERVIAKIPFGYSVKKEMEKFLRKTENNTV